MQGNAQDTRADSPLQMNASTSTPTESDAVAGAAASTDQEAQPAAAAAAAAASLAEEPQPAAAPLLVFGAAPAAAAGADDVSYGAATASLSDPACVKGTPEFLAAKERNAQLLQAYNTTLQQEKAAGRAKPDMIAFSTHRDKSGVERYGHLPGIAVGDEFVGRGELAVLGLHTYMMQGINPGKRAGALAIVLSGGYKDDIDSGSTFWYTGAGGQNKQKQQINDQNYEHRDNKALLHSFNTQTPIRVFRGKQQANPQGGAPLRMYVYEGLYSIIAHRMVASEDGPKVVQFQMQGVPGHSVVSSKVEYNCLNTFTLKRVQLASRAGGWAAKRRAPANYTFKFKKPSADQLLQQIHAREASGKYGRLVCVDVSQGAEKLPIPMWNDLDNDDSISTGCSYSPDLPSDKPPEFEYHAQLFFGEPAARALAVRAHDDFVRQFSSPCGIEYHGGKSCFTDTRVLDCSEPYGVMECEGDCVGPQGSSRGKGSNKNKGSSCCLANRMLADGITYPLELFKVPGKGWGVRCSVDVPGGAVLCAYVGAVITDTTADRLRSMDAYLFDMDHFIRVIETDEQQQQQLQVQGSSSSSNEEDVGHNPNMPSLSAELRTTHLVIDASHEGNVARFINHSCDPNCIVQPVFAGPARWLALPLPCDVGLRWLNAEPLRGWPLLSSSSSSLHVSEPAVLQHCHCRPAGHPGVHGTHVQLQLHDEPRCSRR